MIQSIWLLSRGWVATLAIGLSLLAGSSAGAGENLKSVAFPKGSFTLQAYSTYAAGLDSTDAQIPSVALGGSYYVLDNLSLGAEASGYYTRANGESGAAYSLSGVLRHHFLSFDRYTIFADVSFGPVENTVRIPSTGTYFNFATRTGLGMTFQLRDHLYLIGGARYFHLSNAQIEGAQRNPSINGVEGFLGLMWCL